MKPEIQEDTSTERQTEATMHGSGIDFNRLYGDLCRKLLNTPVGEIFPGASPDISTSHVTGSTSPNSIHPAFPSFTTMANSQLGYMANYYSPNSLLMAPMILPQNSPEQEKTANHSPPQNGSFAQNGLNLANSSLPVPTMEDIGDIDIQTLVDRFKVTLERYGVSQRFAARFIMQDTSQGNLSFLMEKGRNKKWEELSPRGRIPYIKMKKWLESKDQQMATLDMLKYAQETKRYGSRDAFNRRERFTMFQLKVLCRLFEENPNPPMNVRNSVAERLEVPLDRVNVWFQNQRARGFPARKMLQQSLYSDLENSGTAEESTAKDDKDSSDTFQGSLNAIPRNVNTVGIKSETPDRLQGNVNSGASKIKPEAFKNGGQHISEIYRTFTPVTKKVSEFSVKSEPFDTSLPLDLSAAANIASGLNSESASPEMLDLRQISPNNNGLNCSDSIKQEHLSNNTSHVTSGAAKRKRGLKQHQQHKISAIKAEVLDSKNSDYDIDTGAKRRKVDEEQSSYTYLFDTADNAQETSDNDKHDANEYKYVIELENNSETSQNSPTNEERINRSSPSTVMKEVTSKGHNVNTENSTAVGKVNGESELSVNGSVPKESVAIFNAFCASLVKSDVNEANLKEPDLD